MSKVRLYEVSMVSLDFSVGGRRWCGGVVVLREARVLGNSRG